ncbi:peptidase inhibitor family I36 protein [Streptomyces sp. NPDC057654]|uniref:peptidase inhibitor family I36 protein n=1 Tax=Streptomyces sp. NPDC057654 TaxID=3346196 RepID=UPI0036B77843
MRSAVSTTLAAAFLVTTAATAHAAPQTVQTFTGQGLDACPYGYLCLYENVNFNADAPGLILKTNEDIRDLATYGFDDKTSSVYNNTPWHWGFFYDKNYSKSMGGLDPIKTVNYNHRDEDNKMSSLISNSP